MKQITGSRTHENLKRAFAWEAETSRRYLYFARIADVEGFPDVARLFRDGSEAETGHALGHLDLLKSSGDPMTGVPIGDSRQNLLSAIEGETREHAEIYPSMARIAREEGFPEIAEWFEKLTKAERNHAGHFTRQLEALEL